MEAIVTTDWHLDLLNNIFSTNPEYGIKLQMKDIEKPFIYALDKGIKNIIIPGDIGQSDELSSLAKFYFINLLMKYDGLLNIHIIPGNHDYNTLGVHSLKLVELLCDKNKFDTVKIYVEPTKVKIDSENFYFIPFPYNKGLKGYINVAHIEPQGALRDNGRKVTNGTELDIETNWIIGHLHSYQTIKNAVLPGTLYQCNFGEKRPKGFVHIKVKRGKMTHKFIEINPSFTYNTLYVETIEDWSKITKAETDFYRIYIKSSIVIPDDIYNLTNVLQISGKIKDDTINTENIVSEDLSVIEDDSESLKEYLKTTYAFNNAQVKRSLALVEKARSSL